MEPFNTQAHTTYEQSKKLIALGLKQETADIEVDCLTGEVRFLDNEPYEPCGETMCYWSLHRLIKLSNHKGISLIINDKAFEQCIDRIEKRINAGVFNKDWLNENL